MKAALLHYWLTNMRGGEKVLAALAEMFPGADIYTHALGLKMRDGGRGATRPTIWGHPVTESFITSLPFGRKVPQAYLPLMPMANRSFKLDGYDLIISSESGPIKGIRKPKNARHICYCHTPMRYVWDMYEEYYRMAGLAGKLAMPLFVRYMRYEDLKSADSVDQFVANSRFVADRIKRVYGRDSVVVYPPVDIEFFSSARPESAPCRMRDYYLLAGQMVTYKRPDLAIAACVRMNRHIVVIGNGGMRKAMEKQYAGNPLVKFLGRVGDDELRATYSNAKALLFPGVEDFGIVPVEAQAAGTPVVAYGVGGTRETVVDGQTGLFFGEQTVESLCNALEEFESRTWLAEDCMANAARFSPGHFRAGMTNMI